MGQAAAVTMMGARLATMPARAPPTSDWGYSWIPVVGPLVGGALGGIVANLAPIIVTAAA